ncbi:HEAT repeat domain-containing protein [Asanoa sp. NPDC050611]|uniref:HEAT repeat domain-containing protein n=1 Tax=Asanoa sp. NPDC050611 TaxID=3157098 RepID=UPI0033CEED8A
MDGGLARLLAALGGDDYREALARFLTLHDDACAALLAVVAGDVPAPPTGAAGAHPRAVVEDAAEIVYAAAQQWPERFESVVTASPALRRHSSVVYALRNLRSAGSEAILVAAAQVRAAGNEYLRATAVGSLLVRRSKALTDLLPRLLGDRADVVRHAALDAAGRYGDERALTPLRRIVDNPRRKHWERDKAGHAIARITRRQASGGGRATTS